MNVADIIRRSGRNLSQAKGRTILTSLAIAVGAFTIALALAAGNGGRHYVDQLSSASGDAFSLSVYPRYTAEASTQDDRLPVYGQEDAAAEAAGSGDALTNDDIARIRGIDGVEAINPALSVDVRYVSSDSSAQLEAPVEIKVDRTRVDLVAGELVDNTPAPGEVTVPQAFIDDFGFTNTEAAIGQTLRLNVAQYDEMMQETGESQEVALRIVAVDAPSGTNAYYQPVLRISPEDGQKMYTYQRGDAAEASYYGLSVLLSEGADVRAVQDEVGEMGYDSFSLADQREVLMSTVNIAQWGLAGFGALAIIASIFGIINTQYISVLERTQQIGLMKALGARGKDVSRMFRYEALWIGFLGGLIGLVLAFGVTLFNPVITSVLELDEGTTLLMMDWLASGLLVAVLMLVSVLSGFFPARKAAKLDPIEALRTE